MKKTLPIFAVLWAAILFAQVPTPLTAQAPPEPAPAPVEPQKPAVTVTGPSAAYVEDLPILVASAPEADHVTWYVDTSSVQVPPEDGADSSLTKMVEQLRAAGIKVELQEKEGKPLYALDTGGKMLFLSSHVGVYRVVVSASNEHGVTSIGHNIVVTKRGDKPQPGPPQPGPAPPPEPPAPSPDKYGLTAVIKQVVASVQSPTKADDAKKIAGPGEADRQGGRESLRRIERKATGSLVAVCQFVRADAEFAATQRSARRQRAGLA
jgi:nucleotide-binding universal stress UspA family protein